ncbi:MAG: metallophosphoesterase [Lachnospiraceae bacterium]|nr:metallophosphoesterase [Lachnospiraceae bacterium]
MKKIVIVSDTHRQNELLYRLLELLKPIDMLIHCGDIEGDNEGMIRRAECPVHMVAGNNDYGNMYPSLDVFEIEGHRVLLTHGHRYSIYRTLDPLYYLALENQAEIVMFGHLHVPVMEKKYGITILNPGSLTYPRQANRLPSYIMMTVKDNGSVEYDIRYLEKPLLRRSKWI